MLKIDRVIDLLDESSIISQYNILVADEIYERAFYKIRCKLIPSQYKLEIRYIKTEKEFIYSYQVFCENPIVRWDNSPHYPNLNNFPHHFQNKEKVKGSNLNGNLIEDLEKTLAEIPEYL